MSEWEVPWECINHLVNYQEKIRGYTLKELLEKTTFKEKEWLSGLGVSGMTLHPDNVWLDDRVTENEDMGFVTCVLAHELCHVAQQEDWGHVLFMLKYGWEAFSCMFRYERMKLRGIEKEAFAFEHQFGKDIGYYQKFTRVGDGEPGRPMGAITELRTTRVSQAVDLQLKHRFVRRGDFKPKGKTAWAKRR